ncbi:MAG: hypothetical protein DHS20C09_20880 [marine bacterium B5-7]|nr:MAG: hypothetical protein DHS20C09_20880 [marine bacterium B5-7]
MSDKAEIRESVKSRIRALIHGQSDVINIGELYDEYRHVVAKSTFYRWFRQCREEPGDPAVFDEIRSDIPADSISKTSEPEQKDPDMLHISPPIAYLAGSGRSKIDYIEELRRLLVGAHAIADWASESIGPDGAKRPRNPKLALLAQKNMISCVLAIAKVQQEMLSIERVRQFHRAIFDKVATRDAALVREITDDVKTLMQNWGMDGSGFL